MADTFVDGCGVFADAPVGKGTRIRYQQHEDRQQDISVYLEDGKLHVLGMYRPLLVSYVEDNHLTIETERWNNG